MGGPWEDYQQKPAQDVTATDGPWTDYQQPSMLSRAGSAIVNTAKSVGQGAVDMVTGEGRREYDIPELPDIYTPQGMSGTIMSIGRDDLRKFDILRAATGKEIPGSIDRFGNVLVTIDEPMAAALNVVRPPPPDNSKIFEPRSTKVPAAYTNRDIPAIQPGQYYLNNPGLSGQDARDAITSGVVEGAPAMLGAAGPAALGVLGAASGAAIGSIAQDMLATAAGSQQDKDTFGVDPIAMMMNAGIGGGSEALARFAFPFVKKLFTSGRFTPEKGFAPDAKAALANLGINADDLTPEWTTKFAELAKQNVDLEGAAKFADADTLPVPVPLSKGDISRRVSDQSFESSAGKGSLGSGAYDVMERFRGEQQNALKSNAEAITSKLGTGAEIPPLSGFSNVQDRLAKEATGTYRQAGKLYDDATKMGARVDAAGVRGFIDTAKQSLQQEFGREAQKPVIGLLDELADSLGPPPRVTSRPTLVGKDVAAFGPAGVRLTPLAGQKRLFHETTPDKLNDLVLGVLSNSDDGIPSRIFLTDDPALAIGQGANRGGVRVTFRGDAVSGLEHAKPGTGIVGGREYQANWIGPDAIDQIFVPEGSSLDRLSKNLIDGKFDPIRTSGGTTYVRRQTPAGQSPAATVTKTTVQRLESFRGALEKQARSAGRDASGISLRRVKDQLDEFLDGVVENGLVTGEMEAVEKIKEARGLWRTLKIKYDNDGIVGALIEFEPDTKRYIPKVEPEAAARTLFTGSGIGFKSGAERAAKVLKSTLGKDSPEWQQLKQEGVMRLLRSQETGNVRDAAGNLTFSGDKFSAEFRRAMRESEGLMKTLFSPEEISMLRQFERVALRATNRRTGAVNFSNSAEKILGVLDGFGGQVPGSSFIIAPIKKYLKGVGEFEAERQAKAATERGVAGVVSQARQLPSPARGVGAVLGVTGSSTLPEQEKRRPALP